MTIRKPALFLMLLLSSIIAANLAYYWFVTKSGVHEQETPLSTDSKKPLVVPPPMDSLGQGTRMPTPEELEGEARYNDQQVVKASESLNDPNPAKRVGGVEQLSAFPTPESEQILVNTLGLDFDAEVRRAAAQSLSVFKQPSQKTVTALLTALQDDSEAVQREALNALAGIAGRMENGTPPFQSLLANLSNQARAKRMKAGVRQSLLAFLKDQQPSSFSSHYTTAPH